MNKKSTTKTILMTHQTYIIHMLYHSEISCYDRLLFIIENDNTTDKCGTLILYYHIVTIFFDR